MSKILWKSLLTSPAILSAALMASHGAVAAEAQTVKEINQTQAVAVNAEVAPTKPATVSTTAKALQEPTVASLNKTQQVALKISEPTSAATTEVPSQLNVETSVAQAAPDTANSPADTNLLNQIERYGKEGSGNTEAGQVTNVSQFRDVQPSDWAYEALSRVVQTYGCLQGYPDGTYRGNRALSRYEFAAGLNACLRQIEALIANRPAGSGGVSSADLQALQRLTEEFRTELATIGTRVDNLEGRTAFLEQRQFSTTTKLAGEAILALTDTLDDYSNETVFGNRVRLDLRTSFTGRDTLHTRLAAGNLEPFNFITAGGGSANSFEGQQTFNISPGGNNNIKLDWLGYYFPLGASKVYLTAQGGTHSDYAATNNPYFEDYDGGNGALSTFAQHNPIYRIGGGAGGAITLGLGGGRSGGLLRPTGLTLGYLASNGNDTNFNGFLKGDYAALGQLNLNVTDRLGLALTYVHGYQQQTPTLFNMGGTAGQRGIERAFTPVVGTGLANNAGGIFLGSNEGQLRSNSYGLSAALRPSNNLSISGFVGKTDAQITNNATETNFDADIWYYGAGIALPNFGKEGNVLGIFAGVEPTLRGLRVDGGTNELASNTTGYHIEGFYKYQLTDNISITPGVIYLTNPGQSDLNPDMVIGTLRTTMTF